MILTHHNSNLSKMAQLWIGKSFFIEKNYKKAVQQFQFIIDKKLDNETIAEAIYHIALVKFQTQDTKTSINLLKSILKTYNSWSKNRSSLLPPQDKYFIKTTQKKKTIFYLKIFLNKYKKSSYYSDALAIYIEIAKENQETKQIISFLDKILANKISEKQILKILHKKADILFQAQLFHKASKVYQDIYKRTPPSGKAEILYMKAQANYKLNLYEQALHDTKEIIDNKIYISWKPDAYFLQAEIYFALE